MEWETIESLVTGARLRIIDFLQDHEGELFYEKELAEKVNLTPSGVHRTIKPLLSLGIVTKIDMGRMNLYRIEKKNAQHVKRILETLRSAGQVIAMLKEDAEGG